jgi:hypothetical protein
METKKLGMIAAAALTVLAAQANAGEGKQAKSAKPAAANGEMCLSAQCGSAGCGNKSEMLDGKKKITNAADCKKLGGTWGKPATASTHKH